MGIQFRQVSYHYPSGSINFYPAISDISLSIAAKGEFIAIVGHTGSGKSTLAQHMNALIFPTSGEVEIFGSVVSKRRDKKVKYNDLRQKVGLVFQFPEYQLFEETVEKDIMFGPINFKVPVEEAREIAKKAIVMVGLDESYLRRNPFNLSGGEKRRVAIAGILALDPEILVLDEPTSGLDPQGKKQMMELFKDIQDKTGKTIILITHDMDLVYEHTSRVIVLNDGLLVYDGSPDALFKRDDLAKYHLNYPETIRVLSAIKERFGVDIDVYQKDAISAANVIRLVMGQ
ncbi:MAG: energy-coupling factor transporter ATPase [Bacilli bacterium]|nr:energy-coupling factor transporter ATPase [Bacilli bacterium]MBN2696485.1 energy-coupling factor transporter ATPase [Bacilli bacterium]